VTPSNKKRELRRRCARRARRRTRDDARCDTPFPLRSPRSRRRRPVAVSRRVAIDVAERCGAHRSRSHGLHEDSRHLPSPTCSARRPVRAGLGARATRVTSRSSGRPPPRLALQSLDEGVLLRAVTWRSDAAPPNDTLHSNGLRNTPFEKAMTRRGARGCGTPSLFLR
jgi:hypothetical protein